MKGKVIDLVPINSPLSSDIYNLCISDVYNSIIQDPNLKIQNTPNYPSFFEELYKLFEKDDHEIVRNDLRKYIKYIYTEDYNNEIFLHKKEGIMGIYKNLSREKNLFYLKSLLYLPIYHKQYYSMLLLFDIENKGIFNSLEVDSLDNIQNNTKELQISRKKEFTFLQTITWIKPS